MIFDCKVYTGLQIIGQVPKICSLHKAITACTEERTPQEEEVTD